MQLSRLPWDLVQRCPPSMVKGVFSRSIAETKSDVDGLTDQAPVESCHPSPHKAQTPTNLAMVTTLLGRNNFQEPVCDAGEMCQPG